MKPFALIIWWIGFFSSLIFLVYYANIFAAGYHNIDICHNEKVLSLEKNLGLEEVRLDGGVWSLDDCYLYGLGQVILGFNYSLLASFMLGVFVCLKR